MNITFSDKKLRKIADDHRKLMKAYGKTRATKIQKRLEQLRIASTLEEARHLPGSFHELTNDRKGQWTCDLDQPYRLVFEPHEEPIPTNDDGQYIWSEIRGVDILEIINYHKER